MQLIHYYHVYADGAWETALTAHVAALRTSGLNGHLDEFNIGVVGTPENRQKVQDHLGAFPYTLVSATDTGWEQETLNAIHDRVLSDTDDDTADYAVLYAHTKGAAHPAPINDSWRQIMTHFCVQQWEIATEALSSSVASGAYWAPFDDGAMVGRPHCRYFAGNFWWATASALRQLEPPSMEDRYAAELWIGTTSLVFDNPVANLYSGPLTHPSMLKTLAGLAT